MASAVKVEARVAARGEGPAAAMGVAATAVEGTVVGRAVVVRAEVRAAEMGAGRGSGTPTGCTLWPPPES